MRAYLSVDMEGIPGVVSFRQVDPSSKEYEYGRRWMIMLVKEAVEELLRLGVDEITVNDAHGWMTNLPYGELPEKVSLLSGYPKPICMVCGINEEFDAAFFLGYHSGKGVALSVMDHTMSSRIIQRVLVNGLLADELFLNAAVAGDFDVPVVLVAGDDKVVARAKELIPGVVAVELKRSYSRYAALTPSLLEVRRRLREGVEEAVRRAVKEVEPYKLKKPVKLEVEFTSTAYADVAENLPRCERVDGLTVRYVAADAVDAYKVLELLLLAAIGVSSLVERR